MLSRFRDKKEIAEVLEGLAEGKVDIVIGTHRMLSQDVVFKDLGLLVVDEEQRFGVRHKERIKQLKHNVDVLTMSATPIPRTLHMSLLGLRDMSVIETPPKDRLAIHTVVAHYDHEADSHRHRAGARAAADRSTSSTIAWTASTCARRVHPGIGAERARSAWATGRWAKRSWRRRCSDSCGTNTMCFVCTTIAENGLDIPLANTMIIENAERLRSVGAVPIARPRGPVESAGVCVSSGPRRHRAERDRAQAAGGAQGI